MLGLSPLLRRIADWLEREPAADEEWCPHVRGPCWQHRCKHFVHILGTHPQTGAEIDKFDCAIKWIPTLLCEVGAQTRQAGAAIESFRNETVRNGEQLRRTVAAAALHMTGDPRAAQADRGQVLIEGQNADLGSH